MPSPFSVAQTEERDFCPYFVNYFAIPGVYRRFKYNEDLIQSSSRENAVDNSTSDMRLDVTPPPKPQGRSPFSPMKA